MSRADRIERLGAIHSEETLAETWTAFLAGVPMSWLGSKSKRVGPEPTPISVVGSERWLEVRDEETETERECEDD